MNKSPSRVEVYCVMAIVAVLVLFAQERYYQAVERLTLRIEAAVKDMPRQQQQQSIINEFPPTEAQLRDKRVRELHGLPSAAPDDPGLDGGMRGQESGGNRGH